ncbi:4148_t:CDS:2 [Gigaspora margarita]|uniref:4148_t:CDS:1 n=1 Tax=Gigaspora margarita TaxID=4874 RepID=A0ABN7UED5_GIGMA|nr:4148_t:CDS:2 [Gigaspora margarita]
MKTNFSKIAILMVQNELIPNGKRQSLSQKKLKLKPLGKHQNSDETSKPLNSSKPVKQSHLKKASIP